MPCRPHFSESWMQKSIISNEKVSYLYLGVLPENSWMSFLHSSSHYSLRKSLKYTKSDHLINIKVEKYGPSAFKCRVACIFPSPGRKDPSYRMKKFLTYIWKYFLRTGGCRFYTLLIPKVTLFVA